MLRDFLANFATYPRRIWAYAVGEVISMVVFCICFSTLAFDDKFQIGQGDAGMGHLTAMCFMALSAGSYVFSVCLKKIDHE